MPIKASRPKPRGDAEPHGHLTATPDLKMLRQLQKNNNFYEFYHNEVDVSGHELSKIPRRWLNRLLPATESMKDIDWQRVFGRIFFIDDHGVLRPLDLERVVAGEMSHFKDLRGLPYNVGEILQQFTSMPLQRIHHYANNGEYLRALFDERKLVDMLIHVKDKIFAAHRVAVACHSVYFARALILNQHQRHKLTEVRLDNIEPRAFYCALRFFYTGQLYVNDKNVNDLVRVANHLQSPSVLFKCLDYLGHLSRDNLAEAHHTNQIMRSQVQQILNGEMNKLPNNESFLKMPVESVEAALGEDDVKIDRELDVFYAAMAWLAYELGSRRKYLDRLMRQVRFTCMTPAEIIEATQVNQLIRHSPFCRNRVMEAIWLMTIKGYGTYDPLCCPSPRVRTRLLDRETKLDIYGLAPRYPVVPGPYDDPYIHEFESKPTEIEPDAYPTFSATITEASTSRKSTFDDNALQLLLKKDLVKTINYKRHSLRSKPILEDDSPDDFDTKETTLSTSLPVETPIEQPRSTSKVFSPPKVSQSGSGWSPKSVLKKTFSSQTVVPLKQATSSQTVVPVRRATSSQTFVPPGAASQTVVPPGRATSSQTIMSLGQATPNQALITPERTNSRKPILTSSDNSGHNNWSSWLSQNTPLASSRVSRQSSQTSILGDSVTSHISKTVEVMDAPSRLSLEPALEGSTTSFLRRQTPLSSPAQSKLPSPAQSKLPSPAQSKLPSPAQSKLPSPAQSKLPSPAQSKLPSPAQSKLPSPAHSKLPSPAQSKLPSPAQSKLPSPAQSKPPSPAQSKLPSPAQSKLPSPAQSKLPSPVQRKGSSPAHSKLPSPAHSSIPPSAFQTDIFLPEAAKVATLSSSKPALVKLPSSTSVQSFKVSTAPSTELQLSANMNNKLSRSVYSLSPQLSRASMSVDEPTESGLTFTMSREFVVRVPMRPVSLPLRQIVTLEEEVPQTPEEGPPPKSVAQEEGPPPKSVAQEEVAPPKSIAKQEGLPQLSEEEVPYFKFYSSQFDTEHVEGRLSAVEVGFRRRPRPRVRHSLAQPSAGSSSTSSECSCGCLSGEPGKAAPAALDLGCAGDILAIGGYMDDTCTGCSHAQRLRKGTSSWEQFSDMPETRINFAAAYLDGYLYVVGGYDPVEKEKRATRSTFWFDTESDRWKRAGRMKCPRAFHCLCSLNGLLYAIGGQNECEEILSTVEVFNPDTSRWSTVAPMSVSRVGASAVDYRDTLVVAGGYGDTPDPDDPCPVLMSTEWFDPDQNRWTKRGNLRIPRAQACLVQEDSTLYFLGGATRNMSTGSVVSVADVDRYDAQADSWTHLTDLNIPRHNAGATVLGRKIYVVGGVSTDNSQVLRSVEVYDLETDSWDLTVPDLPFGAKSLACVVVSCPGNSETEVNMASSMVPQNKSAASKKKHKAKVRRGSTSSRKSSTASTQGDRNSSARRPKRSALSQGSCTTSSGPESWDASVEISRVATSSPCKRHKCRRHHVARAGRRCHHLAHQPSSRQQLGTVLHV